MMPKTRLSGSHMAHFIPCMNEEILEARTGARRPHTHPPYENISHSLQAIQEPENSGAHRSLFFVLPGFIPSPQAIETIS